MKDLTGEKFGRYTILEFVERRGKNYYWKCKCDCGNERIVQNPKSSRTVSCGCYNREVITKHGLDGTKLYHVLNAMKHRCYSKKNKSYHHYGGRGITICDEWLNDPREFVNWANENGYEHGLTIDRINVNGNYEPSNCRWVTPKRQGNNTRVNVNITFNGETHTLHEWSEILGIPYQTLHYRVRIAKWDIEKALTKPVGR